MDLSPYRKVIVALLGAVAQAVNLGLLPDDMTGWVTVGIGFATAVGVYEARNDVKIRRD